MVRTKFPIVKKYNKRGPKRVFTNDMLSDAENLVGMYGARTKELALFFDVHEKTIAYWIRTYPQFDRAVKRGRVAIGLKVSKALVAKALGYSHPDTHVLTNTVKTYNEDGKIIGSHTEPLLVQLTKHYPPDACAAHKYLTIMFRETWAENSTLNINQTINANINVKKIEEIPLKELNKDQKELLFQLNMKQLNEVGTN